MGAVSGTLMPRPHARLRPPGRNSFWRVSISSSPTSPSGTDHFLARILPTPQRRASRVCLWSPERGSAGRDRVSAPSQWNRGPNKVQVLVCEVIVPGCLACLHLAVFGSRCALLDLGGWLPSHSQRHPRAARNCANRRARVDALVSVCDRSIQAVLGEECRSSWAEAFVFPRRDRMVSWSSLIHHTDPVWAPDQGIAEVQLTLLDFLDLDLGESLPPKIWRTAGSAGTRQRNNCSTDGLDLDDSPLHPYPWTSTRAGVGLHYPYSDLPEILPDALFVNYPIVDALSG